MRGSRGFEDLAQQLAQQHRARVQRLATALSLVFIHEGAAARSQEGAGGAVVRVRVEDGGAGARGGLNVDLQRQVVRHRAAQHRFALLGGGAGAAMDVRSRQVASARERFAALRERHGAPPASRHRDIAALLRQRLPQLLRGMS